MHTIVLPGRLVKDAEVRAVPGVDKVVGSFTLAVDDGWGDNKSTMWFKCTDWRKQAETLAQYLKKGTPVTVFGRLAHKDGNPRVWESKDGPRADFEVNVVDVVLQGKGKGAEFDEDIPF